MRLEQISLATRGKVSKKISFTIKNAFQKLLLGKTHHVWVWVWVKQQ